MRRSRQGRDLPAVVIKGSADDRRIVYWRPDLRTDDAPDTGSLAGDMEALIERAVRNDTL